MAMVMPRSRSSGALSMLSKERSCACPCKASVLVMAAVRLVLPWSTCPIVPTFTCGLARANFCFPIEPAAPLGLALNLSRIANPLADPVVDQWKLLRWLQLVSPRLGNHFLRDGRWQRRIVVELHRVRRSSLGCRAEIRRIPEHRRQRHERLDNLRPGSHLHPLDVPTPGIEIANDLTHELVRRRHLDIHDRLEDDIASSPDGFLERERTRNLECHF